jgi:glycosyltransferase involved in cell wall biosynthesis
MKLLGVCADFSGSSWYRIIQPMGICTEMYEESKWSLPERLPISYLNDCDMVILQRQCDVSSLKTIESLLDLNKIIVTEIDDNLWSIPASAGKMKEFWTKENIKGFENILKKSHAVTVSTERLGKLIKEFNNNVFVLKNLVVFDRSYVKPNLGKVRIGWAGSDTHLPDFTPDIQDALLDIKDKYKDKVDILMFGHTPIKLFTKTSFYSFIEPHLYLAKLQQLGIDIGLVPNLMNFFNDCRSNVKYVEYSSVGAVTVANEVENYKNTIINGTNGILIKKNNRKSWFNAIRDLIENPDLRASMAHNAYNFCYKNYSIQENSKQYQVYGEILNKVQGG